MGSITASQDISASGDMFAVTGSFQHLDVTGTSNLTGDLFIDGNITASGVISASGDLIGDDLQLGAGRITRTGGTGFIDFSNNPVTGISSLTASADISASGDLHGAGLIVEGNGAITGSLFVSGSSTSVELRPEDQLLVDSDNIILTGSLSFSILGSPDITGDLFVDGNITASNNISASGTVTAQNITTRTGTSTIGGSTLDVSATAFQVNGNTVDITVNETTFESPQFDIVNSYVDFQTSPITASHNISSSATVFGLTGSFDYLDLSGTVVNGSSVRSTFGPATSVQVTHNLGEDFPIVQVYTASNRAQIVPISIISDDTNNVTVTFAYSTTGSIVILK